MTQAAAPIQRMIDATNRGDSAGFIEHVVTLEVTGNGYNGTGDMVFTLEGDRIKRMIIS